jgi:putative oxidoreductase
MSLASIARAITTLAAVAGYGSGVAKTIDTAKLTENSGVALALFRVVLGFMFALHGTQKLFAWPPADALQAAFPVGAWPAWWAGVIELVAGMLIMLGLSTRIAAFIASGTMAVAYFWQHQPLGLLPITNGGESAVLYCFGFLVLVFTGAGAYALDNRGRAGTALTARSKDRARQP